MSTQFQYTPLIEIPEIHAQLRATFKSGVTRPLAYRRKQLLQLARLIQDNITAFEDAELEDLGKPRQEVTMIELAAVIQSCLYAAEHLEEWSRPEKPIVEEWRSSWDTTIYKVPKGISLIISPWNYPVVLTFNPLVGAIAAGCPAVLKPSESTPRCSALMTSLARKYLDPAAYTFVNGAIKETTTLLDLRWDHIFFTGGTAIGKIIATAAAKFVTPLTLELGGKSPVIVDSDCDIEIATKRILWGKSQNSGQLCVSPDYVLVPKAIAKEFKEAIKKIYHQFWPKTPLHPDAQWGNIVNTAHHSRVKDLINGTRGEVILGGGVDGNKRIAMTVITGVDEADRLMEKENFGPVLPVVEVENVDEAIDIVANRPHPLVIYVFTNNEGVKQKLLQRTNSGGIVFNDTVTQLGVREIPFGGHGDSGYGAYFGKSTFDIFTHSRGSINVPQEIEPHFGFRYPPYTAESYKIATAGAYVRIPEA